MKKNITGRKKFLKTAGSTALFAYLGIGFIGCSESASYLDENIVENDPINNNVNSGISISNNGNTITIDLTANDVSALNNPGGWLFISAASTLVLNVGETTIRAFTSVCTHQGCSDSWQFANNQLECTCHGSRFATDGSVIRGPASRDLNEFNVVRNGDVIAINK